MQIRHQYWGGFRLLLPFLLMASVVTEPPALLTAKKLYFEALEGNGDSLSRCIAMLSDMAQDSPRDPTITAYLGSAKLLESARTLVVWRKGKLAKEGLEMLDRAVQAAPHDLEVRFLRAATCYRLPGWFDRSDQAERDFAVLAPQAEAAARDGRLDPRLAAAALYFWGEICKRNADTEGAKQAWAAAVRIAPGSRAGVDAARKLRRL
jgi:hypothetical protein